MNKAKALTFGRALISASVWLLASTHAQAQQPTSNLAALEKQVKADDKLPLGHRLFEQRCAICHGSESYHPGTRALERRSGNGSGSLQSLTYLTPAGVKAVVRNGLPKMFPFRVVDLSDQELDAIANYVTDRSKP